MLTTEHRAFLLSRSYTEALINAEEIRSLPAGEHNIEGDEFKVEHPVVAWICRSMSGQLIGVQTRRVDEHEYRWHQAPKAQHLPIIYGSPGDYQILYDTGRMVMTEGAFDRAAIKRCLPDYAVFARLSKGIAKQLLNMTNRYGKLVWLAFDQDEPGRKATETATERLKGKMDVYPLKLPAKDPSKLIESIGEKRMKEIVERQVRALEI